MFDLEAKIREWRKGLRRHGAFEDGGIAELESHLRDAYDRQRSEGRSEEEAFAAACRRVGDLRPIAAEYRKAGAAPRTLSALVANYGKVALRKLRRQGGLSFINIVSLSLGLTCCLLLLLWIQDELGYDRYHIRADRIYRVERAEVWNGETSRSASTSAPLAPALQAEFSGLERVVRIGENGFEVVSGESRFQERMFFADPEIFDVFSFPLAAGDPATVLRDPDSLILSEDAARKYFGSGDPLGRVLTVKGWKDFRVTGVAKNVPRRSHFRFDFLASFPAFAGRNLTHGGARTTTPTSWPGPPSRRRSSRPGRKPSSRKPWAPWPGPAGASATSCSP